MCKNLLLSFISYKIFDNCYNIDFLLVSDDLNTCLAQIDILTILCEIDMQ